MKRFSLKLWLVNMRFENRHDQLSFMLQLCDQAYKTWMLIFDRENQVKSCQEACRVRSLAERAMMRLERRSALLYDFKYRNGLH